MYYYLLNGDNAAGNFLFTMNTRLKTEISSKYYSNDQYNDNNFQKVSYFYKYKSYAISLSF